MKIYKIIWTEDRIDHISAHGITPDEVEETCFDSPMVLRGKSKGENPVYYVLGQTDSGRYLFCVIILFSDGNGYPVTARDMTKNEKQRYKKWRNI